MSIKYSKDRPFYHSEIKPMKQRTCFQVGNNLYKTKETAAKKLAWSWIFTKYGGMKNTQHPSMEDIKELYGMVCECWDGDEFNYPPDSCPIHDRQTGYFKRLHKRTVKSILKYWENNYGNS